MKRDEILKILERAREEARNKYRAEIRGFFGSYARGDENPESDLDVLVEFLEGATLLDLAGLGNFLEERFRRRVDVVSKRAIRKEIAPHIFKDLITL